MQLQYYKQEEIIYEKNIYTNAPPLIRTALKKDDGWAYRTDGHTMCISGYRNDLACFHGSTQSFNAMNR